MALTWVEAQELLERWRRSAVGGGKSRLGCYGVELGAWRWGAVQEEVGAPVEEATAAHGTGARAWARVRWEQLAVAVLGREQRQLHSVGGSIVGAWEIGAWARGSVSGCGSAGRGKNWGEREKERN